MKKKGFTLIELLAVIIIFGIIIGIAVTGYSKYVISSKNKSYNIAENSLKSAATDAVSDCITGNGKNREFCDNHNVLEEEYEYNLVYLDELIENTKTISYSCSKAIQNEYFGTLEYQYNFNIINDNKIESPNQLMVFTFLNQNYYNTVNIEDAFKTKKPDKINRDKNKLTKTYLWYTLIGNDEIGNVDQYLELVQTYGYTCNK